VYIKSEVHHYTNSYLIKITQLSAYFILLS